MDLLVTRYTRALSPFRQPVRRILSRDNRHHCRRCLSATSIRPNAPSSEQSQQPKNGRVDPKWLTMTKTRIGKCLMFGLKPAQVEEAGRLLQRLAVDWRELVIGSEGFLTDERRRAVFRHNVVWGEMVCFHLTVTLPLPVGRLVWVSLNLEFIL